MNPALRRSAAHVFVESLEEPVLSVEDQHHVARVLRARDGEVISISDGRGCWRETRYCGDGQLEIAGEIVVSAPRPRLLTIGCALPKGDRTDWIVQKLTEIGIDRIVLVDAERSIVHWDDAKAARQLPRLGKVAREAAMQSRRVFLPTIQGPVPARQLAGAGVAIAEPDGSPWTADVATVLVGPEGGWTAQELAAFSASVDLGPTILRVDTAALVAATRLTTSCGGVTTL